jgi:hypothetical protein
MPSIFIWKTDNPNTSKKTVRYYSGANWILEDNDFSSKSYMYLNQIVISESDNSVITFHTKDMPQDWVGTELLEVSNVPYEFVKSDTFGTLEKVGDWMRFTTKGEIDFCEENLKKEFSEIKKWMNKQKNKPINNPVQNKNKFNKQYKPQPQTSQNTFDPNKVQLDFQQFLIKYSMPVSNQNNILTSSVYNNSIQNLPNKNHNKFNTNTSKTKYNKKK